MLVPSNTPHSWHGHSATSYSQARIPYNSTRTGHLHLHSTPTAPFVAASMAGHGSEALPQNSTAQTFPNATVPPPVVQSQMLSSRGERYRPVNPFSRRRASQSIATPGEHLHYPTHTTYPTHSVYQQTTVFPIQSPPAHQPTVEVVNPINSPIVASVSDERVLEGPSGSNNVPNRVSQPSSSPAASTTSHHHQIPSPDSTPLSPTSWQMVSPVPHSPYGFTTPYMKKHSLDSATSGKHRTPNNGSRPQPWTSPIPQQPITIPPHTSLHSEPGQLPYPVSIIPRVLWWNQVLLFATNTIPREVYLAMLLHLPALYYSRVTKVFTDAELCLPDIERMFRLSDNDVLDEEMFLQFRYPKDPQDYAAIYLLRFKASWEEFISNIISEWQVQNVVSVLLLSAVLTLLQIDDIARDPLSRSTAVFSLLFALMALLHGCVLMARFGSMKKLHKAAMWAEEARRTTTFIFWNVWVFLSMPAVWLAWSVIAFLITVLSYVWRTGANEHYEPLTHLHALAVRITLSGTFAIGLIYFALVLRTLAHYGSDLERRWNEKVVVWKQITPTLPDLSYHAPPPLQPAAQPPIGSSTRGIPQSVLTDNHTTNPGVYPIHISTLPTHIEEVQEHIRGPYETLITSGERKHIRFYRPPTSLLFQPPEPPNIHGSSLRIVDAFSISKPAKGTGTDADATSEQPAHLLENCIDESEWKQFRSDVNDAWKGKLEVQNVPPEAFSSLQRTILDDVIRVWNTWYFGFRGLEAVVEEDEGSDLRVALYDNCIGLTRVLNEDQFTVSLEPRWLSVIEEESDIEEERVNGKGSRDASWPSSRASSSPQLALSHLRHFQEDDLFWSQGMT